MTAIETTTIEALFATYASKAEPVGVKVDRVSSSADAAIWLSNLRVDLETGSLAISGEVVATAPGLISALDAGGVKWSTPAHPQEARDAPFGVSIAKLAVAETGSVLMAEDSLPARAVGLLSLAHVTICRTSDLDSFAGGSGDCTSRNRISIRGRLRDACHRPQPHRRHRTLAHHWRPGTRARLGPLRR